jgi:predicted NBD/HSP70 family sugar kinase
LTYVLIDIEGKVRQYARRRTLQARRPEQVIAAIADQMTQLVTAAGIRPAAVLGLGAAAPGPLDVVESVLLKPPSWPVGKGPTPR